MGPLVTMQVKELRQEEHVRGHSIQYGECQGELPGRSMREALAAKSRREPESRGPGTPTALWVWEKYL